MFYVYEIHLREQYHGLGLGRHLLSLAENIAASTKMKKVMLTVFTSNEAAVSAYKKCGWVVDEDSPAPKKMRGGVVKACDYLIMSKSIEGKMGSAGLASRQGQQCAEEN